MDDVNENHPFGMRIMELANNSNVSDFYVTPWEYLSYKVNGKLVYDETVYQPTVALNNAPGCLDYALVLGEHRFRVNRMVTRGKPRWVLRLLPSDIPDMFDIGVPHPAIKSFLEAKNGLFLICGATGSGKSTTIASMIQARAMRKQEHIITFEDPIEFIYPSNLPTLVSQREMGTDDLDFGKALRAALRQAPDVIVIGEIRDGETAEIALQASETGHVVVATLHTSSASQTVQRFLKLIPSDRMVTSMQSFADCMRLILCQKLMLDETKGKRFPVHEMLLQYDSVIGAIRRGEFQKLDHELETGFKKGMFDFQRCLEAKMREGWVPSNKTTSGYTEQEIRKYFEQENINIKA